MIIGNFSYDRHSDTFVGQIKTLSAQQDIHIQPSMKSGKRPPDYEVVCLTASGAVDFGLAWRRVTETGEHFIAVKLDDPSLCAPLTAVLFNNTEDASATLYWGRATPKSLAAATVRARRTETPL